MMDHFQQMESLMSSMMADPFGGMFGFPSNRNRGALMPFGGFGGGFMHSMDLFSNFDQLARDPNCHSFSSSTIVSYTTDNNGRPQVYRSSESTRAAPGGIRETKKSIQDSRTGLQKMSIGHHIHDKAHIIERSRNRLTGEEEENEEFQNLDEEEADTFNQEWEQRIQRFAAPRSRYNAIGSGRSPRRERAPTERLAITNGNAEDNLHLEGQHIKPSHRSKHGKEKPAKSFKFRRETNM